jgi:DNA-directed RNA polymerase I, II, and III subunit RPABC2
MDEEHYNIDSDIESENDNEEEYEKIPKNKNTKKSIAGADADDDVKNQETDDEDEDDDDDDDLYEDGDVDADADDAEEDSDADEDSDAEEAEETILEKIKTKSDSPFMNLDNFDDETDDPEDEDDDEDYLQKIDDSMEKNIISKFHPELMTHNNDEIETMCRIVRNENGVIIDPLHKTIPFITRYEKARILGERAKQLNCGAQPMVAVEPTVLDGYLIALKEFEEKKIPFIVKRPLPNGGCEYWRLSDLEILS